MKCLRRNGAARFVDLYRALAPISRTTLSNLLAEMVRLGDVEHVGRLYRPARSDLWGDEWADFPWTNTVRARTQEILEQTAKQTGHACALFAWVGASTMKIVDQYNLEKPHWRFSPVGYEWPLVPFHGFAKVFLAYGPEEVATANYGRWSRHLKPELIPDDVETFEQQLADIRKKGYALEYQEELSTILRLVVPVRLEADGPVRFALGLVARYIYLLEVDNCLEVLREQAAVLASAMRHP